MIRWFLLQNRAGRTRLAKYYVPLNDADKRKTEYEVFRTLSGRESKWSNIVEVRRPICWGRPLTSHHIGLANERQQLYHAPSI
jgi:hypothetical protein